MEVRKDLMIKRKVTRRHDRTRHARNTISIVKHCALHSRERNEDRKSVFPPFLNTNTHSAYACVRAWVDRRRCVCVCACARVQCAGQSGLLGSLATSSSSALLRHSLSILFYTYIGALSFSLSYSPGRRASASHFDLHTVSRFS